MFTNTLYYSLNDKKLFVILGIYITLILFHWSYMSPLYHSNEWIDPNIYFTIGKAIFNGKVLYADVFDPKGPVIFFIYGFSYLISPDSFFGFFLIEILTWTCMIFAIYRTAKLFLWDGIAFLITVIFPCFLAPIMNTGGSPEEFILAFECISLYFFTVYFKEKELSLHNPYIMLIHGILFSLVVFCKINLSVFWFFPVAGIFLILLLKKAYRNFAWNLLAFVGGFSLIAIPIFIYFYVNHAINDFYISYIETTLLYANIRSISTSIFLLFNRLFLLYCHRPLDLFVLPLLGIFYFPFNFLENKFGKWVFMLSGMAVYIAICVGEIYLSYYPIPFLVFSALGIISIFLTFDKYIIHLKEIKFVHLILILVLFFHLALEKKDLTNSRFLDSFKENPGLLTQNLKKEIMKEQNPTLLVLSGNITTNLFTTCRIMPNTRFFFPPYIDDESFPTMRKERIKYIENKEVQFVIFSIPIENKQFIKWKREANSIVTFRKLEEKTYQFYTDLPMFRENYELCLRDTIMENTYSSNILNINELYKRKE